MDIRNIKKIMVLLVGLMIVFLLAGCLSNTSDKIKIIGMSKNLEEALQEKDIDLFMKNISSNYIDLNGGTYDNHINNLPEDLFAQLELLENLLNPALGLKVVTGVSISNLTITDSYASGKMEINISLKLCLLFCTNYPGTDDQKIKYNVDFQKESDDWKIISLVEI